MGLPFSRSRDIQQVLIRSLKTSRGLARRCGKSERQRAIWLFFTGKKYQTSDQHKDTAQEQIVRDHSDGLKILQYIQERDPFTADENLINLSTKEDADKFVNVHQAFEIGEKLIRGMKNQIVFSFCLKCKGMVVPMKTKSSLSIEGEKIC